MVSGGVEFVAGNGRGSAGRQAQLRQVLETEETQVMLFLAESQQRFKVKFFTGGLSLEELPHGERKTIWR